MTSEILEMSSQILVGHCFAGLGSGGDSQHWSLLVWDLARSRFLRWGGLADTPGRLTVTRACAVAWTDWSAVWKADAHGWAQIGCLDYSETDPRANRLTVQGDTLSWLQSGAMTSYRLIGAATGDEPQPRPASLAC